MLEICQLLAVIVQKGLNMLEGKCHFTDVVE